MIFFQDDEFPTSNPEKVRFYQHSDGYPRNVAKDLADFFVKYNRVHPPNADYHDSGDVAAHFINFTMERSFRCTVQCAVRHRKRALADGSDYGVQSAQEMLERNRTHYRYMGYRIVPAGEFHDDIEWLYVVTPTRVFVYHTMHDKRGNYNDFEARNRKDNWILVSTEEEACDIRHGRFPERFDETSDQALYLQEVQKFVAEEERVFGSSPQLSLTR
jgi:hypothetical protein